MSYIDVSKLVVINMYVYIVGYKFVYANNCFHLYLCKEISYCSLQTSHHQEIHMCIDVCDFVDANNCIWILASTK